MSAITDAMRLALHNRAREVLGRSEADTLMAHLPPVGWADVATKESVDHRAEVIEGHIDAAKLEVTATMERGFRRQAMWVVSLFVFQQATFVYMVERLAP